MFSHIMLDYSWNVFCGWWVKARDSKIS